MEMWMPSTGSSGRPLSEKCGSQNSDWQAGLRVTKMAHDSESRRSDVMCGDSVST